MTEPFNDHAEASDWRWKAIDDAVEAIRMARAAVLQGDNDMANYHLDRALARLGEEQKP